MVLTFQRLLKNKFGREIEYSNQIDELLNDLLTTKYIAPKEDLDSPFFNGRFLFCREWNSYYPSFYNVIGGCYVIQHGHKYTLIDPGYKTIKALLDNGIDTRLIENIIITHNHPDHSGGLIELINLLFTQNKEGKYHYSLYLNPGTLELYKYLEGNGLEIFELEYNKEILLNFYKNDDGSINKFSFIPYRAYHKGIGNRQQSISLIFNIKRKEQLLKFGITSDTDGRKKYFRHYKRIYKDLFFLVVHIGTLKIKQRFSKADKHLYLSGVYRLLDKSNDVKAFILQEFGMELMPSVSLSQILSNVIFRNGFFFPFLIYNIHSEEKKENHKKNLISLLFPKFFEKFINILPKKYQIYKPSTFDMTRIVEFSHALCLDIKEAKYNKCEKKITDVKLYNLWEKNCNEKRVIDEINSKLNDLWIHIRNSTYFKSIELKKDLVKNIGLEFDSFFPEVNFCDIISYNSKLITSLLSQKAKERILDLFTEFFSRNSLYAPNNCHEISINLINRHYREVDFIYFSVKQVLDLKNLQIFPILIFMVELINSKSMKYPDMSDLRATTLEKFKEIFPNKNIYLGNYGKTINFNIFFDPYNKSNYHKKQQCEKECLIKNECEILRDGKYLFDKSRQCPYEIFIDQEHELINREAYEYYYEHEEESYPEILEEERKYKLRKREIRRIYYHLITLSLVKGKYKKALRLLQNKFLDSSLKINNKFISILERDFKIKEIKMMILLLLLKSHYNAEISEPIAYAKYYRLLKELILELISSNKENIIIRLINNIIFIFKIKPVRNFESDIVDELNQILLALIEYIIKYPEFNDHWRKLYTHCARIIRIVDEPLKKKIRNLFMEKFKFIENVRNSQKNYLISLFIKYDKEIVRIIKILDE